MKYPILNKIEGGCFFVGRSKVFKKVARDLKKRHFFQFSRGHISETAWPI